MPRIAKYIADAGLCSRRDAEKWILAGRVAVNGEKITSPALNVGEADVVKVDGKAIAPPDTARMWLYHKPAGLVTTHKDPEGRPTVFENLPKNLPRVISVGRLDLSSEGLLLLTTSGDIARKLEHPSTNLARTYRVRLFGTPSEAELQRIRSGITVEGVHYGKIEVVVERATGSNAWLVLVLREGKNREIRRIFEHLGYRVNRLIRVSYGEFKLGDLPRGDVREIPANKVKRLM